MNLRYCDYKTLIRHATRLVDRSTNIVTLVNQSKILSWTV